MVILLSKKNITSNQAIDDMVLISYDFQAGNYIEKSQKNPVYEDKRSDQYAEIFNSLGEFDSIMEVGVGEGTTFAGIVLKLNNQAQHYIAHLLLLKPLFPSFWLSEELSVLST